MANCFNSEGLSNPLRYYQNYSYNGCVNEGRALCHYQLCGCCDFSDPGTKYLNMYKQQKYTLQVSVDILNLSAHILSVAANL